MFSAMPNGLASANHQGLALLLGGLGLLLAVPSHAVTTKTVCPAGPPTCDASSIQTAVDTWLDDDVIILVSSGVYRLSQELDITNKSGSSGHPAILRANGLVVIDCADSLRPATWNSEGSGVYSTSRALSLMNPPSTQLHVGDKRYEYLANHLNVNSIGEWGYDDVGERVYVHVGGASPSTVDIFVGDDNREHGIEVRGSSHLFIDGFTIKRASQAGIDVEGTSFASQLQSVQVMNCEVTQCWGQGIRYKWAAGGSITDNRIHDNGDYGIHVNEVATCSIAGNSVYKNDDPLLAWGGIAGIKLAGPDTSTACCSDITIDYNVVYGNEDSGIDLVGAKRVAVRRNLCYENGDHGFDNNKTNHTAFLNNVAFRNDHAGLSAEPTSTNVSAFNNIFVNNGQDGSTLAGTKNTYEIEILNFSTFYSNNNIIRSAQQGSQSGGTWWRRFVRFDSPSTADQYFTTFEGYRDSNSTDQDANSYGSMPSFTADTTSGVFEITSTSDNALDAGETDDAVLRKWLGAPTPFWLTTDVRGYVTHDYDGQVDAPDATDIGAWEFDSAPGALTSLDVLFAKNSFSVNWTNLGDDGDVGAAYTVGIYLNGGLQRTVSSGDPYNWQCEVFESMPQCQAYSVQLKITENDNGKTAWSNTVNGSTQCSGNSVASCDGNFGEDVAARRWTDDASEVDFALELAQPTPNPANMMSTIRYSVPRSEAGKRLELAVFDVAGRRVGEIVRGTAKAGLFVQDLGPALKGKQLSNGMYFLRMMVGESVLKRSLVLAK